jgi:hypothetical protein
MKEDFMSPTVRVRMYRQGLGDCFLLTFPRKKSIAQKDFHMLIDCGVIAGTQDVSQKMTAVVNDIFQATGGHLDLLVGTHEHWDHVSGFNQVREIFDKFTVKNVWLAWTEDPNNPLAIQLREGRTARLSALRTAVASMEAASFTDQAGNIRQILSFFGDEPGSTAELGVTGQTKRANTTREAMNYLSSRPDATVRYCFPKDPPQNLPSVDDVRIYVFGPPEDLKLLKMSDPTKKGQETYGISDVSVEEAFFAAISPEGEPSAYDQIKSLSYPFDTFYQVLFDEAKSPQGNDFFHQHYGFNEQDPEKWRRIDADWLNVASELALNLDNDTNNTSLVLAIEIGDPGDGKVLLFAADAQVGNWLSWESLSWNVQERGQPVRKITSKDLLSRTIFYKVGHHGSHNATLRQQGLELMVSNELVAMIPVDHNMAVKKRWNMPFPELYGRLKAKTEGRVLRIDDGIPNRQDASTLTDAEWQAFINSVIQTDLYIEYSL